MRDQDGLSFVGFDQSGDHITQGIICFGQRMVLTMPFNRFKFQAAGRAAHGDKVFECVAARDIHPLGYRPKTMCRVEVSIPFDRILETPIVRIVSRAKLPSPEVVEIAAFSVEQFTEHAMTHHVEQHQFCPVIIAVFHGAAVFLVFFRSFDYFPAPFQSDGAGDLSSGM